MSANTINRREALTAGAAVGLAVAGGISGVAHAQSARVPGVQLYTVRDSMATDLEKTLQAIAGIGYQEVEFAGYFGYRPSEVRAVLSRYGLRAPSTHVNGETVQTDPNPFVNLAAEIGHDYVTIAYMQPGTRQTADDWKRWAEVANRLGEACRKNGMRAAYHNHDFELQPVDGIVPLELLIEETDPDLFDFEIDMYWVRRAGVAVLDVLRMAPERMTMAHIKDMDPSGEIADVGDGTIDFAGILADPAAASMKHLFVEHDHPQDQFRTVAASYQSLDAILSE